MAGVRGNSGFRNKMEYSCLLDWAQPNRRSQNVYTVPVMEVCPLVKRPDMVKMIISTGFSEASQPVGGGTGK
jgi:hypothetical protein